MVAPSQPVPIRPRGSPRWGLIVGAVIITIIAVLAVLFRPRYTTIRTAAGATYDIIEISRDDGIGAVFGPRAEGAGPALYVNYYARVGDLAEARQLQEYAVPFADSAGLRFIVVSQTTPTLTRWLPFVHGQMWAWRRWGVGSWRLVE